MRIGQPDVHLHVQGLPYAANFSYLVLNFPSAPIACGPCQITYPLASIMRLPSAGLATFTTSVPCELNLVGAAMECQWWTVTPGTTPCPLAPSVSFSNRVLLTVGI